MRGLLSLLCLVLVIVVVMVKMMLASLMVKACTPATVGRLRAVFRLVASQFGEGGVHLVGEGLVPVLVDAELVWKQRGQCEKRHETTAGDIAVFSGMQEMHAKNVAF